MVDYQWCGDFTNDEVNHLHAEAFDHGVSDAWDWRALVAAHSLGWVVARRGSDLVGFVNVVWDGLVHAWIQDTMVDVATRRQGVGTRLIAIARDRARTAGCHWLHVDFDEELRPFYIDACGFTPTEAGLIDLV